MPQAHWMRRSGRRHCRLRARRARAAIPGTREIIPDSTANAGIHLSFVVDAVSGGPRLPRGWTEVEGSLQKLSRTAVGLRRDDESNTLNLVPFGSSAETLPSGRSRDVNSALPSSQSTTAGLRSGSNYVRVIAPLRGSSPRVASRHLDRHLRDPYIPSVPHR